MRPIDADAYQFPGDLINEPTIDAVPVVRCKECKHLRDWKDGNMVCWVWTDTWDAAVGPDDFCSYGERKEEPNGTD